MDEAFLNDLLECSVCLDQLDSSSKVLPCQHTFCKRCLEEIVNSHKELRCPECRVLVETKVDELPCNILLIRLLEGIKNNPRIKTASIPGKRSESCVSQSPAPTNSPQAPNLRQGTPITIEGRTLPKQVVQTLPCAKAVYPYEGKEPGDLSFKKGDVIILRKRIDQNWYHGEVNGKSGFLPARYVQVMVPLPTHIPQCKALYDFSIGNNDEKDCLTFLKGEVITVIRRVDDNWAEGKLADRIGIFPMSFVEMNVAARALMKLSVNTQPGPSRVAPPTPTTEVSQVVTPPVTKSGTGTVAPAPQGHDSLSSTTTTPSPASSTTSPSTPSSSSSSSTSLPSAALFPVCTEAPGPIAKPILIRSASQRSSHQREKRHSLSSLTSCQRSPQIPTAHRHSLEILSSSGGDVLIAPNSSNVTAPATSSSISAVTTLPPTPPSTVWEDSIRIVRRHSHREKENAQPPTSVATVPVSSLGSSSVSNHTQTHAAVPTFYMALYNYRPQKEDELELKKGELYTVSEKCQDGWFKGTSLRTSRSGVFPGNYVQIAKTSGLQAQFHQTSSSVANVRTTNSKSLLPVVTAPPRPKPPVVSCHQSNNPSSPNTNKTNQTNSSPTTYVRPKQSSHEARPSVAAGLLEWARSVASIANVPQRPPRPQVTQFSITTSDVIKNQLTKQSVSSQSRSPNHLSWLNNLASCGSFAASTSTPTTVTVHTSSSMAASYPAPSGNTHAQQNLSNFPNSSSTGSISQSWHSGRSTSQLTPSPLLSQVMVSATVATSPPNVSLSGGAVAGPSSHSKADKHKERKDKCRESLMKRLTSKRKSRSPPPANFSCDNPSFVDNTSSTPSPLTVIHVRSGSCPSEVLGGLNVSHKKPCPTDATVTDIKSSSRLKQAAQLTRERFRCIVPYPPNSEYELELKIGDIVYVHKKREDGWYKGTLLRTGKTGLFPASFVDKF